MKIENMRAEFEAWCLDFHVGSSLERYEEDPDVYRDWNVQCVWRAWQASRAALVVELPGINPHGGVDFQRQYQERCKRALEAQGVTVK